MDIWDSISKALGIVSPVVSIIAVIITNGKSKNESGLNITRQNNRIVVRPTLTMNKSYVNNYTNLENSASQIRTEDHLQSKSSSDVSEWFILIAVLFMFVAFIALKRIKQLIIMSFLLISIASVLISLLSTRRSCEPLRARSLFPHFFFCVAGTVFPLISNYQLYQPLPFDAFYAKLFPHSIGGLGNILANMFVESTKLRQPTYYYLSIFIGLILIALYELIMLTSSIKFCRTKKAPQHKFILGVIFLVICALTVTGITYQILYSIGMKISSGISWVSSPSFHLS